jgi:hypothetical protein
MRQVGDDGIEPVPTPDEVGEMLRRAAVTLTDVKARVRKGNGA